MINPENLNRILFVTYYGRSGSIFLQSLLDDHPSIVMFPGAYICRYSVFWNIYGNLLPLQILGKFADVFAYVFDANLHGKLSVVPVYMGKELGFCEVGDDKKESICINKNEFIDKCKKLIGVSNKISSMCFFQIIHSAYTSCVKSSTEKLDLPIILYQIHEVDRNEILFFLKDFPNSLFIQVVRDPVQSLGSMVKSGLKMKVLSIDLLLSQLDNIFLGGTPVFEEYRDRSFVVRLEDIHDNPYNTLLNITEWLGIPWHDNLLTSTFNGKKWWNLKDTNTNISGFNNVTTSVKHEDILPGFDRFRFKSLLKKQYIAWGYNSNCMVDKELLLEMNKCSFKLSNSLQRIERIIFNTEKKFHNYLDDLIDRIENMPEIIKCITFRGSCKNAWELPVPKIDHKYKVDIASVSIGKIIIKVPLCMKKIIGINRVLFAAALKLIGFNKVKL